MKAIIFGTPCCLVDLVWFGFPANEYPWVITLLLALGISIMYVDIISLLFYRGSTNELQIMLADATLKMCVFSSIIVIVVDFFSPIIGGMNRWGMPFCLMIVIHVSAALFVRISDRKKKKMKTENTVNK